MYRIPESLRNGTHTWEEVAIEFGIEECLMRAVEHLPVRLQNSALCTVTSKSVETTKDGDVSAFGWYWNHSAMGHRIALSYLPFESEESARDTFAHELSHFFDTLCRGRSDHSVKWRKWATILGANPRAFRYDPVFTAAAESVRPSRKRKVVGRCTKCHQDIVMARRRDFYGRVHVACRGHIANVFETWQECERFSHYHGEVIVLEEQSDV